jgi:hypothetical protein
MGCIKRENVALNYQNVLEKVGKNACCWQAGHSRTDHDCLPAYQIGCHLMPPPEHV